MPETITCEAPAKPRQTPPALWSWRAGRRTGITDDKQHAFGLAEQYAPESADNSATVSLVSWMPALSGLTGWYLTRLTWTAQATRTGIEWSGQW